MLLRWRRYLLAPVLGVGIAGALLVADGENGLVQLVRLRDGARELKARLMELEQERSQLTQAVHSLRSDSLAVERLAREKLGLVRPREFVIRLENRLSGED